MKRAYNNKLALVTGGSRGIGAAISEEFAKNGCDLLINYVNNDEEATKIKSYLEKEYQINVSLIKGDISSEKDVLNILDTIKKEYEHIDYLINNAGIAIDTTLEDKTVENFKKILDVNLIGTFLTCKHIGLYMKEQGYGSIINISSTNGIDSFYPYSMDYDASKAGVISLTHNFALSYAPDIRVNTIAPGWVNTEMNKELGEEYIQEECQHILLNRFAETNEIAEVVYFVANSKYLNDSVIKVDGGRC